MLPKHLNLTIHHNPHKSYYQTVGEYVDDPCSGAIDADDFESADALAECIAYDELWTMQVYPNTPVGFWSIAAPSLGALLVYAAKQGD